MPQSPEQQQAFVQAKDLSDNNISIDLVPIVDEFDYEPFYKEFLCQVCGIEESQFRPTSPKDQKYSLLNRQYNSNFRKACLRHLNFELSDGVAMSCDIYSFSRTARKPNTVKMYRDDTTKVVVGKRSFYVEGQDAANEAMDVDDEVPQRQIPPGEQYKSQNICGKQIIFRPGELVQLKSLQSPGLRLLGFKPMEQLQPRWMIKRCMFLYPNDKKINGSATLFRALWRKCLEKRKYALCTLTTRRDLPPKYAFYQSIDLNWNRDYSLIAFISYFQICGFGSTTGNH